MKKANTYFMGVFYQNWKILLLFTGVLLLFYVGLYNVKRTSQTPEHISLREKSFYWLLLHRKSNIEFFYFGKPGVANASTLVKAFQVKTGIPNKRPTPLPKLFGREYWILTDKSPTNEPETAPYFLSLDIPVTDTPPYGPVPYPECDGQCNWELPGSFGLHGVNADESRLSSSDPGSSGCIRHRDADITYLYNILDPQAQEIRYYIEDI